jgi:hypothetical protein
MHWIAMTRSIAAGFTGGMNKRPISTGGQKTLSPLQAAVIQ